MYDGNITSLPIVAFTWIARASAFPVPLEKYREPRISSSFKFISEGIDK
jgi:hypothetical protein